VRPSKRTPGDDDMTSSEYQELADFFIDHVGRIKEETRTIVAVTVESLRDDIRRVADGVLENGRRIEGLSVRVDALTDRVGDLESTVSGRLDHHEERIRRLE
jgi:hypothetical protein